MLLEIATPAPSQVFVGFTTLSTLRCFMIVGKVQARSLDWFFFSRSRSQRYGAPTKITSLSTNFFIVTCLVGKHFTSVCSSLESFRKHLHHHFPLGYHLVSPSVLPWGSPWVFRTQ